MNKKNTKEDLYDENTTFFCSELVAAAYKFLGLIDENIPASNFWPNDFSNKKKILFNKENVNLSDEFILEFGTLRNTF